MLTSTTLFVLAGAVCAFGLAGMTGPSCHASQAGPADDAVAATPIELGAVAWGRNLDEAKAAARATGRPVLLLFQEVPGCHGCVTFGEEPMSHPLLVEAIETEFIPVAIHNNKPGYDERILKQYEEPAWNYPVMRLLDADGADILPRQDKLYTVHEVAQRLVAALKAAQREVPAYLQVLTDETSPELRTATLSMHCYWEGEGQLGGLTGVRSTRAGWRDQQEVVDIQFDPKVISYADIIRHARGVDCARTAFVYSKEQANAAQAAGHDDIAVAEGRTTPAKASDQKHTLRRDAIRYVPMTPGQQTKINAAIHRGGEPIDIWMSPRQRDIARAVTTILQRSPDAFDGLELPDHGTDLAAYQRELFARIAKHSPLSSCGPSDRRGRMNA